jgi:chaperonin GroES
MQSKLLKTDVASFSVANWDGSNTSGFVPMSDKVMIRPDTVDAQTRGGIALPETITERMNLSAESGIVIAMGPEAFKAGADGRTWVGDRPEPGAHVYFERYAGQVLHGRDGVAYRIMDARCIGALALEDVAP